MKGFLALSFYGVICFASNDFDVKYLNIPFGHIHETPYKLSGSETSLACGFPLKVFKKQDHKFNEWVLTQAGDKKGYVLKEFISGSRPKCFQKKYTEFYNSLELSLADLYYWGRLYDQYLTIETKP